MITAIHEKLFILYSQLLKWTQVNNSWMEFQEILHTISSRYISSIYYYISNLFDNMAVRLYYIKYC